MNKVILEIGAEEIPAAYLEPACKNIKESLEKSLAEKRIKFEKLQCFYSVRRLIAFIEGVADKQEDLSYSKKGPAYDAAYKDNKLTDLGNIFISKNNITEKDIIFKEEKGKKYLFIEGMEKGGASIEIFAAILPEIIKNIKFPKSMIWDGSGASFARPVRWILALFNDEIINFKFGSCQASNKTRLHKFLQSGAEQAVKNPDDYFSAMAKNGIIVNQDERKKKTQDEIKKALAAKKLTLLEDDRLMQQVADSVESISVMIGEFDKKFLFLPVEVIITAMREHQRYFGANNEKGEFTNYFVNIKDGKDNNNDFIVKQHAKVLFSRLEDAAFFFKEDLKEPLEKGVDKLKDSVFIAGLGSMLEKVKRLEDISSAGAQLFGYSDSALLLSIAGLSKADLVTNMIGEKEYVGLRGFMGGVYLEKQGRDKKICAAVKEHYLPNFAGDKLPSTIEGTLISLLDKTDNAAGFFIAGFKPTGSKDPYAVRRQALNIIYTIIEKRLDFDYARLIAIIAEEYKKQQGKSLDTADFTDFFRQREVNYIKDRGIDYDIAAAVVSGDAVNFLADFKKAKFLSEERHKKKDFDDFAFLMHRTKNIIPAGYKPVKVNQGLFKEEEEKKLYSAYLAEKDGFAGCIKAGDYGKCYGTALGMKKLIDSYFDKVLVMSDNGEIKNNNLSMLAEISGMFDKFADFSKIVVDRK